MSRTPIFAALGALLLALFCFTLGPTARAASDVLSVSGALFTLDLGAKELTVKKDDNSTVTLKFNKQTVIERNGKKGKVKKLVLQDSIQVQYNNNLATKITANGPKTKKIAGKLDDALKANGTVVIKGKTVQTTAQTHISRNGKLVSLSHLTRQDTIVAHVKPTANALAPSSDAPEALDLICDGPDDSEVYGVISAISGAQVTITPQNGTDDITITVNDETLIEKDGEDAALGDLAVGMKVEATFDPDSFVAYSIEADSDGEANSKYVIGTVADVNVDAGTVAIDSDHGQVTLNVNASTEIEVNNVEANLEDIQVGMPIYAEYDSSSMDALKIRAGNGDDDHEDASVEGTVSAVDVQAASVQITPLDDGAPVTLFVTHETEIEINGEGGSIEDIHVGDAIKAEYNPQNNEAYELHVGSDDGGGGGDHTKHAEGMILAIDLDAKTVTMDSEYGEVTLNITDETKIKVNGEDATLADVKVGQFAHATYNDETMNAEELETKDDGGGDHMKHVEGMVLAVNLDASTVTLDTEYGEVTLNITDQTEIHVNGELATLADVQVGQHAHAVYDETTNNAQALEAEDDNGGGDHMKHVDGTIVAIDLDGSSVTISEGEGGDEVTLTVNGDTEIKRNGEHASLADLQVGDHAEAVYDDTNNVAHKIEAWNEDHHN